MRRSRNLPLPAGRLDNIIFVSGITTVTRVTSGLVNHLRGME
jgi:hypothetical protein